MARYGLSAKIRVSIQHKSRIQRDNGRKLVSHGGAFVMFCRNFKTLFLIIKNQLMILLKLDQAQSRTAG
jgi:hypothetical protein